MRISTYLISTALLAASAWAAQPQGLAWPRIREGRGLRVVTADGEVCNAKLKLWRPDSMRVRVASATACGATNGVLLILPPNVLQISADPNAPWRVIGPSAVRVGGLAAGVRVVAMSAPGGAAVFGAAFAISRLIHQRAPDYSVFLKQVPERID